MRGRTFNQLLNACTANSRYAAIAMAASGLQIVDAAAGFEVVDMPVIRCTVWDYENEEVSFGAVLDQRIDRQQMHLVFCPVTTLFECPMTWHMALECAPSSSPNNLAGSPYVLHLIGSFQC